MVTITYSDTPTVTKEEDIVDRREKSIQRKSVCRLPPNGTYERIRKNQSVPKTQEVRSKSEPKLGYSLHHQEIQEGIPKTRLLSNLNNPHRPSRFPNTNGYSLRHHKI